MHSAAEEASQSPGGAIHAMLHGIFDYAGLFPPARLPMADAAAAFHRHLHGPEAWLLGRFIVPARHLETFQAHALPLVDDGEPWRLSVLIADWGQEREIVEAFGRRYAGQLQVESVECLLAEAPKASPGLPLIYAEVQPGDDLEINATLLKDQQFQGKLRCGGLMASAFPSSQAVVAFLSAFAKQHIALKATAGLHHMYPATRPAEQATDAARVPMHGFVNLCLAACLLYQDPEWKPLATQLLGDGDASHFELREQSIVWCQHEFSQAVLRDSRAALFHSIGSCSLDQPLAELQDAGWL